MKLDKFEKDIFESYENDEWISVDNVKENIEKYVKIAKNQIKKDKRINIRLNSKDLFDLKKKALMEGIPYQTLVSSIIHKFNNGLLVEKNI